MTGLATTGRPSRIGRYHVLERLGAGGMGVVYKAFDPQLDRLVALKVLREELRGAHPTDADGGALLAEAQTLAKLSHPNIVAVFDAGLVDGDVFIAMELVEGTTLEVWLEQERTVAERVAVFVEAGRGLAAAHASGIEHRDFKPANVLVDGERRIRVVDFGLAALGAQGSDVALHTVESGDAEVSRIVGTPAFMAPERLRGQVGDHRADQFSFCVALYSALFKAPPFEGSSFGELRGAVAAGLSEQATQRLAGGRRVPVRVRRALLRGLASDPGQRFASMDDLLDRLVQRRRWPYALATGTLALGLGVGAVVGAAGDEACDDPLAALQGAWSTEQRAAVEDAFSAAGADAELFERTAAQLDAYRTEWTETHAAICRATYVTREQSPALHDTRMLCLTRQRNRLQAAIQTLTDQDGDRQQRMVAAFRLPAPGPCASLEVAPDRVPLPDDPDRRARVEAQLARVDLAATLRDASDLEQGIEVATEAVARARQLEYPPLLAQALETLGHLQADGASAEVAEATLREAILVSSQSRESVVEARAWAVLLFAKFAQGQADEGLLLSLAAEGAVERAGDPQARAWWLNSRGTLRTDTEEWDLALADLQQALTIKQAVLGEEHFDVGIAWFNLGTMLVQSGRPDEARDALDRASQVFAATVGTGHDYHQLTLGSRCSVELQAGRFAAALDLCERVLAHLERSPSSPRTMGLIHFRTAKALVGLGRMERARELAQRARTLLASDDPNRAERIAAWVEANIGPELEASDEPSDDSGG